MPPVAGRRYKRGMTQAEVDRMLDEIMPADGDAGDILPIAPINPNAVSEDVSPTVAPPELDPAALYGIVGEIVQAIAPHTEAAPAGILLGMLVMLGSLIGRAPEQQLDGSRHGLNLFALLIGPSNDGRKGTAVARARKVLRAVDRDFDKANVAAGLSSGQGLIYHVRDATPPPPPVDGKPPKEGDPGVSDKRLLILEDELAGTLRQMQGRENTLSPALRSAWDGVTLRTLTRANALKASDPHIALLGQITPQELRATLSDVDYSNGLLNRFLFAYVERVRFLPHGGEPDERTMRPLIDRLRDAVSDARVRTSVDLKESARERWEKMYFTLTTGHPGRAGDATRRGAAQVRRLAMLYAVLDRSPAITAVHLEAALALWNYSVDSARFVFGGVSFSEMAHRFEVALDEAGEDGLTRTQLRVIAGSNNIKKERIESALEELRGAGRAREAAVKTGGRARAVWRHTRHALRAVGTGEMGGMGENSPDPAPVALISPAVVAEGAEPQVTSPRPAAKLAPDDVVKMTDGGEELTHEARERLRTEALSRQREEILARARVRGNGTSRPNSAA